MGKNKLVLIFDPRFPRDHYVKCTPEQARAAHEAINKQRMKLQKEIDREKENGEIDKKSVSEEEIYDVLEEMLIDKNDSS